MLVTVFSVSVSCVSDSVQCEGYVSVTVQCEGELCQ